MDRDFWYPWMPADFKGSATVAPLSALQRLAYREMLDHDWMLNGLPDDPAAVLQMLTRELTLEDIAPTWEEFLPRADGRRAHPKLERERHRKQVARTNGKKGGRPKKKTQGKSQPITQSITQGETQGETQKQTHGQSSSHLTPHTLNLTPHTAEKDAAGAAAGDKPRPILLRLVALYNELTGRRCRATPKRVRMVKARMGEGFTAEDMEQAIRGFCHPRSWNRGKGGAAMELDLFLRDAGHVERGMVMLAELDNAPQVSEAERAWLDVMRWATAPRPKHVSKALPPASREALAIMGGARRVIAAHQRGDNYALTQLRQDFIRVCGEEPRPLLAETAGGAE